MGCGNLFLTLIITFSVALITYNVLISVNAPLQQQFPVSSNPSSNEFISIDPIIKMHVDRSRQAKNKRLFHTAVTSSDSVYNTWQCRIMYYWFKKFKDEPNSEMGGPTGVTGREDVVLFILGVKILVSDHDLEIEGFSLSSQDQKQNLRLDCDERSSKKYLSNKTDRIEVSGRGKSHSLPPSGRGQNETVTHSVHLVPGSQKENGANSLLIDASKADDALKAPKNIKKSENQNGNQPIKSRHPTTNGHRVRDVDAPSPVRRESSSQAATNAVKEAKDLKHLADRLKNSGSNFESTGLYFQAALKFLHGASLLESSNSESDR